MSRRAALAASVANDPYATLMARRGLGVVPNTRGLHRYLPSAISTHRRRVCPFPKR